MRADASRSDPVPVRDDEREFVDSIRAAYQIDRMPGVNWTLYLMLVFLTVLVIWAAIARVDVVTRAEGRIVPDGREQIIASLEGGILRELFVREGVAVKAGQIVARLDPTRVAAKQNEGRAKRLALRARQARLVAEASGSPLDFPEELTGFADIVSAESNTYKARRQALQDAAKADEKNLKLARKELKLAKELAGNGLMSNVEVMRLRRQVTDLKQQGQERANRLRQEASGELVRVQNELAMLDEQLVVRDDILERTELRSPVDGLVKSIRVATVGGIVAPGSPIMQIVPLGGRILVEAHIKPADIGFIREGQHARIKLSAYEYNMYGGLEGRVDYISPDALSDTDRGGPNAKTHYRARIVASAGLPEHRGRPLPIRPGMTGSVEISTSERSVLSFVLRPVLKSRDAFRQP